MARVQMVLMACAAAASAQTPANPFEKAPPDVEDALRSRVQEFYQDHVDGKFRKAEQLVAEEAKDGFYAASKPDLKSFTIQQVAYSDNFTKAKVTVVGKRMILFMGIGTPRLMDVPFPSYWKIDGGKWCWYIFDDPNRMTPFGRANGNSADVKGGGNPMVGAALPDVNSVRSAVTADKTAVRLARAAGTEDRVTISSSLPGLVELQLERPSYAGLDVTIDKLKLHGGEKAVVTIRAAAAKEYADSTIRIFVKPTNQVIEIVVGF